MWSVSCSRLRSELSARVRLYKGLRRAAGTLSITGSFICDGRNSAVCICFGTVLEGFYRMKRGNETCRKERKVRPAVIWFTGLSGSGKSTIADRVSTGLGRAGVDVERLDGDQMRDMFPGTGFSREQRNDHLRRVGYLASLLEKHGVTVIASFVSPYRESRDFARKLCRNFVEVYVSTPLAECERRDVKGLYRKARAGKVKNFTGVSDPYEAPKRPEVKIDTTGISVTEAADRVIEYLVKH